MRQTITFLFIAYTLCSCSRSSKVSDALLQGSWHMVSYTYFKRQSNEVDRIYILEDSIEQIKMFHQGQFVWIRKRLRTGADEFGFGRYELEGNALKEYVSLNSKSKDKWDIEVEADYFFQVKVSATDYRQCTVDLKGYYIYCEDYEKIEDR